MRLQYMADIASREEPEDEDEEAEDETDYEDDAEQGGASKFDDGRVGAQDEDGLAPALNRVQLKDNESDAAIQPSQDAGGRDGAESGEDGSDARGEGEPSDDSDRDTIADAGSHRRHRPSARRTAPDVSSIVTQGLRRAKKSTERKHHGKKPVTANVLGRQRGSKSKQDTKRTIKDANTF